MRVAVAIELNEEERATLDRYARGRSTPARLVLRAKIVLRAAKGMENKDIAVELVGGGHNPPESGGLGGGDDPRTRHSAAITA